MTFSSSAALQSLRARYEHLDNTRSTTKFYSGAGWYFYAGYELCEGQDYYWDGLKRGNDPAHPYFIFQYTLDGFGIYETGGEKHTVPPGSAFLTTVPSPHSYYVPQNSRYWSIFYLTFYHPYIVSRLLERVHVTGPVIAVPPETRLMADSISLLHESYEPSGLDEYSYEQALFQWMIEFERFTQSLIYPEDAREQWLQEVRSQLHKNLHGPLDVSALAEAKGMSRTYYSHQFKATTGISPAQYVQQLRLEEATRRLLHSDQKLETIARETGLNNANHFCKVFRRRFHLSPGEFRRQVK